MERVDRLVVDFSHRDKHYIETHLEQVMRCHDAIRPDKIGLRGKQGSHAMIEIRAALRSIKEILEIIYRAAR